MTVVSRRGDEGKEGGGCRGGGGAKREARATTRAQVFVARGHVKFAEGSVQSVIVDRCSIPKGPVSGLDHHWALKADLFYRVMVLEKWIIFPCLTSLR